MPAPVFYLVYSLGAAAALAFGFFAPQRVKGFAMAAAALALAPLYHASGASAAVTRISLAVLAAGIGWLAAHYAKGLKGSPRELWLLFGYKFSELTAYKLVVLSATLWLTWDCGLKDDVAAGSYYSAYSLLASASGVIVGALIDTAGIRRVMLISVSLLLFARFFMVWLTHPVLAFLLGLAPMALGFAMVSPLASVAIKRYTTKAGAAYGFSLFYVLMNLGFTCGNRIYDWAISKFALRDASGKNIDQGYGVVFYGHHFSTYQLLFAGALVLTLISLLMTLPIRDGVVRDETGVRIVPDESGSGALETVRKTTRDTVTMFRSVARERFFWVFLGMIGILIFVRSIFIQWDLILPKYCPRIMGEGAQVGAIASVNTVLILFFVPLVTMTTAKVKSYTLMLVGSAISAAACFVTAIPESVFAPLTHTTLGEIVFVDWLGLAKNAADLAANPPSPFYWSLIFSFVVCTVGEAVWSPRFYQFTAEIAPKGKEATYLSLAVLPTFAAKLFVGPMSGVLLAHYVPVDEHNHVLPHPNHHMVWVWVGVMSAITPVGMLLYKRFFERETERIGEHLADA